MVFWTAGAQLLRASSFYFDSGQLVRYALSVTWFAPCSPVDLLKEMRLFRSLTPKGISMKLLGLDFKMPKFFTAFSLILATLIVTGTIYGIRVSIDDGTVTNKPELLRQIMFWPFSLVLAIRFTNAFWQPGSSWHQRIAMTLLFYIPIGLALAYVGGILPTKHL